MTLKVLHVASELFPHVKTGGLADVAAALPAALRDLGVDARVIVPGYGPILDALDERAVLATEPDLFGGGSARIVRGHLTGLDLPVYVLDQPRHFLRGGTPYVDPHGVDWQDNHLRFAALGRAAAAVAGGLDESFAPDVLHAHDWQAGLAPAYARHGWAPAVATVTTIHNLAYQGRFGASVFPALDLPPSAMSQDGVEYYGGVGYLKAGLFYADLITTVSRTYAWEIRGPDAGFGMDGLLRARADSLYGIVNGVDYDVWDPSSDRHLPHRYDATSVTEGKALAKLALLKRFALTGDESTPLFGVVSRLTWLKGIDLVLGAAAAMIADGARLVVLGTGDPALESGLRALAAAHPNTVGVFIGYDEHLAHLVQAASDIVLVPSRSEPCGLTQMYAMRYGALPLVRNTGGLADTVANATPSHVAMGDATGFIFDEPSAAALAATASWAISFHRDRPDVFRQMRDAAVRADFGWRRAAEEYVHAYGLAVAQHA